MHVLRAALREKVYAAVQEKIGTMKGIKRFMVERALKIGAKRNLEYVRQGLEVPCWLEMQYRFYDSKGASASCAAP